jgi:hypothetical protein
MKNSSLAIQAALLFICIGCSNNQKKKNSIQVIDIESNVDNWEVANLSSFAKSIRYVPLETNDSLFLRGLGFREISGNLILIRDSENCFLYDSEGNFISKIGKKGRGPREYLAISNMGIGSGIKPKIYLSQVVDILEYNIDGTFVNRYRNSLLINDTSAALRWGIVRDSLIIGHVNNNTGKVKLKAVIKDKYGNILHSFKNYDLLNGRPHSLDEEVSIYQFKDLIYYKELQNDTLFYLNTKNELISEYVFNLGEFKEPNSERLKFPQGPSFFKYLHVWYAFQTEDYLFINCQFGNRFPAKRITSKSTGPSPTTTMYNTTYALGIYNKRTEDLFFCEPTSTNNPLFTTGIHNDIDAGPRFFPQAQVNDSTMAMWVTSFDLKMHIQSDDFKNNNPKYPEKKKQLQEISDRLTYLDNPVIMIVTFKKNN